MIAYVLLAHQHPDQVVRLVRALDDGEALFFVHVDASRDAVHDAIATALADHPRVVLTERFITAWASVRLVWAALAGLRAARASGAPWTHCVLVSGADHPLVPLADLRAALEAAPGKTFIEHTRIEDGLGPWDPGYQLPERVWRRHYSLPGGRELRLPRLRKRFPDAMVPYAGSQWWAMTPGHASLLLDHLDAHPKVLRFFRRSRLSDELFFQTLLAHLVPAGELHDDDLRYTDWDRPNPSVPRVLDLDDLDRARASGALIGRKFDEARFPGVLDALDRLRETS